MQWYLWAIIVIVIVIIAYWLRPRKTNENLLESAGSRISRLGSCCRGIKKWLIGRA